MRFGKQTIAVLVLTATLTARGANPPAVDEQLGNAAIAERVSQTAQLSLASGSLDPVNLRMAALMFDAATKLSPNEPRFLKLTIEAYLQLGGAEGRDGAISAVTRYLRIAPADVGAQVQLINLHYSQMETAEARKKYLDQILADTRFSPEVRAQIAVQAYNLAIERTENELAKQFIDQALTLMPLCPSALRIRYSQMDMNTPLLHRVSTALQCLRANPAQPRIMIGLAGDLARAGLIDPSMTWYQQAFVLNQRVNEQIGSGPYNAYAAELIIADQLVTAEQYLQALVDGDPTNSDAAFLSVLVAKRSGNADKVQTAIEKTRSSLLMQLRQISDSVSGAAAPSTRPSTDVDIPADVKKLAEIPQSMQAIDYVNTLAQLAWLEIYFNNKVVEAQQYLKPLHQMLPADDIELTRLDGWNYLIDGKTEEAKVKLSAVADRDPLAALGMMRIEKDTPADQAAAAARTLLQKYSAGSLGALLMEALRTKVGLLPQGPDAPAVRAQLDNFPKDWLDFNDFSKAKNFYSIKADTTHVSHPFGVPMLAKVIVTNISNYDITVGPESAIHPDLWFDVQVKGLVSQNIPGVAFDRLSSCLILRPRDTMTVTVRVDQGNLLSLMMQNARVSHPLYFSVVTNPVTTPNGIVPGPGGYRATFTRVVERSASPLTGPFITNAFNQLISSPADVKIQTIDVLGYYAARLAQEQDLQVRSKGRELVDVIRKSTGDPISSVRAQASLITAMLAEESIREGIIRSLLTQKTFVEKMTGLIGASQMVAPGQRRELLSSFSESESDPLLKQLAASVIEAALLAPATQPTTAPADGGALTTMPR